MSHTYNKILVAVDGSQESEHALDQAISSAKINDAELLIVNIIDTRSFQNVASFDDSMVDAIAEETRETLDKYLAQAKEAGLSNVSYLIEYGAPKQMIANGVPDEVNADLIVIGATGLNAVERLLIGSVTEYVARHANVDVLVVR